MKRGIYLSLNKSGREKHCKEKGWMKVVLFQPGVWSFPSSGSSQINSMLKTFMFYLKQRKAGQIIHTQKYNKKAGNILRKMTYILKLILKWKQVKQSSSRHVSWVKETTLKTVIQGVLLLSNSYLKNVCLYVITVFFKATVEIGLWTSTENRFIT